MSAGLIEQITTTLLHSQNQFASGGLLLMVIGGIAATLKSIPTKIYDFTKHQLTVGMNITDDHDAFDWVSWWFQSREYSKRMRNVDAFTPYTEGVRKMLLTPAPGFHWFFYKGRPLFISFHRTEEKKSYNKKRDESYYLWTWGRSQNFLKRLLYEIHTEYEAAHVSKPALKFWDNTYWETSESYSPRPLESVILPSGVKTALLKDIENFRASEAWYDHMGIPYHRGYLLYGPPGTGKTSLVSGLSAHLKSNVYIMKLSAMTDNKLQEAVGQVSKNSIVILEDIDCATSEVRKKEKKKENKEDTTTPTEVKEDEDGEAGFSLGITLSGLLNALDGMQTPKGVKFFMTTNHIEKLDAALLRPGRTDVRVHLGEATDWQKAQLYMRFFPETTGEEALNFVMKRPDIKSMAEFQEELMQQRNQLTKI